MRHATRLLSLLISIGVAAAADPPGKSPQKGEVVTRSTLPQAHEYQRTLHRFLATLTERDFAHGVSESLTVQPASTDREFLYRNHIMTMMSQPLVGTKRGTPAVNAPPALFLLPAIETPNGVMQPPVWPETLISFLKWDYPGNPYHNNRGLKLRAFVTATVLLVMLDDYFDSNPLLSRWDRFYYQLVFIGLPYPGFKDVLPPEVQQAYESGLKRMGERMLGWGIKGEEPQADLIAPFGLCCVAKAINDPKFTQTVEIYARQLYSDPRYFSPAGYWVYRGGLDIPFQGNANFFAVSTALASEWPFARDAIDRAYRLRAHLILPEPDGKFSGPSHFNSRLGGPAATDQWAWSPARDTAAAMLTDEAAHLVTLPPEDMLRNAPAKRARDFAGQIGENPRTVEGRFIRNDEITSYPWKWRTWHSFNFPASVNPGAEFYLQGAYARRQKLELQNSPLLKSPFERGETFLRDFDREFVVTQQPSFAAILHTGPIGTQDRDEDMYQFAGPMGLSGGQLSAFWTPATGSVILGQRGGMSYDKSFDVIKAWRTWPNHAVSGATADGVFFTSARIQKPNATIDIRGYKAAVKVSGVIPASVVGQEKTVAGQYHYARSFQIDDASLSVETTVSGDGAEQIAELYETLPIYLRDAKEQPNAAPTAIEFQVGGKWSPATDSYIENVLAVRLTRFQGTAVVTFARPRRVKLAPAEWADEYLSRGTSRNVLIDLLENGGRPTAIKSPHSVRYSIAAVKK